MTLAVLCCGALVCPKDGTVYAMNHTRFRGSKGDSGRKRKRGEVGAHERAVGTHLPDSQFDMRTGTYRCTALRVDGQPCQEKLDECGCDARLHYYAKPATDGQDYITLAVLQGSHNDPPSNKRWQPETLSALRTSGAVSGGKVSAMDLQAGKAALPDLGPPRPIRQIDPAATTVSLRHKARVVNSQFRPAKTSAHESILRSIPASWILHGVMAGDEPWIAVMMSDFVRDQVIREIIDSVDEMPDGRGGMVTDAAEKVYKHGHSILTTVFSVRLGCWLTILNTTADGRGEESYYHHFWHLCEVILDKMGLQTMDSDDARRFGQVIAPVCLAASVTMPTRCRPLTTAGPSAKR